MIACDIDSLMDAGSSNDSLPEPSHYHLAYDLTRRSAYQARSAASTSSRSLT